MRKFGIEVECLVSRETSSAALAAAGLGGRQHGYMGNSADEWVIKHDASIGDGAEVVSPPLDFDNPEQRGQVNKAIAAIRSAGGRTDQRAGIHVHVDASDLTPEQVAMVARTFTKFEDIIYRIATSGWRTLRPGGRTYCRPLTDEQVRRIAKAKSHDQLVQGYYGRRVVHFDHGASERYYGLNLHSWFYRGTIEFRIFNSSLNADRIQAYIAMCVALVEDARRGNRRSVNKAYRLGGMAAGTTNEKNAYHRFQQVVRYDAGMDLADYKLMNKCWKDSSPQPSVGANYY